MGQRLFITQHEASAVRIPTAPPFMASFSPHGVEKLPLPVGEPQLHVLTGRVGRRPPQLFALRVVPQRLAQTTCVSLPAAKCFRGSSCVISELSGSAILCQSLLTTIPFPVTAHRPRSPANAFGFIVTEPRGCRRAGPGLALT